MSAYRCTAAYRSYWPLRCRTGKLSSTSAYLGITTSTTLAFTFPFTTKTNPLSSADSSSSHSSTLFREASPAALRRPSSQLVFLSVYEKRRNEWASWVGYFREAGYDCFDMNIAMKDQTGDTDILSQELTSQLRLLSLQRPPLVFAIQSSSSDEALTQIQSKDPRMSGLVIVGDPSDESIKEKLKGLNTEKMRILVVDGSQGKDAAMQEVERWMNRQGLA